MPRGPKPGALKPNALKAVDYVNAENGLSITSDNNTDAKLLKKVNINKEHIFHNALTGCDEYLDTARLRRLLQNWIPWIREQSNICTLQEYWLEQGIVKEDLFNILANEPELKELYVKYSNYIGQLWQHMASGKKQFNGDPHTLRQYAPRYIQEWREYNREEREFIEKIKFALEQQDNIELKKEMAELISNTFIALDRESNDKPSDKKHTNLSNKPRKQKTA